MQFELIAGRHSNRKGTFQAGTKNNIVESKYNLEKIFLNKFKRRHDLELLAGAPAEAITPPQPVEPAPVAPSKPAKVAEPDTSSGEPPAPVSKLGDDVTEEFPAASEADLKVFSKGKLFFVAEADSIDAALNEKNLKSKKAVEDFIKKLIN